MSFSHAIKSRRILLSCDKFKVIGFLSLSNSSLIKLARLDKPWGIVLLAWPTLSALVLTQTWDIQTWLVFSIGIVLTRSAGCVINDYADQWLDGSISRTKERPLVSGELTSLQALQWFGCLMLMSLLLLWFLNNQARVLAIMSGLLMCIYPYTKRFFVSPQSFLGIAFSMGIPIVYANANRGFDLGFWGLFLITVYWVIVYDTIYAMADQEDDRKVGVYSMALSLGRYGIGFVKYSYILIWVLWGLWGMQLAWPFYMSWLVLGNSYYQQVQDINRAQYFKAFLRNQSAGCWVFVGICLSQWSAW